MAFCSGFLKMGSSIYAGLSGLFCCEGIGWPFQDHIHTRRYSWFNLGRPHLDGRSTTEGIISSKVLKDHRSSPTQTAMGRNVFGGRRSLQIRIPLVAFNGFSSFTGASPGMYMQAIEYISDSGDRSD